MMDAAISINVNSCYFTLICNLIKNLLAVSQETAACELSIIYSYNGAANINNGHSHSVPTSMCKFSSMKILEGFFINSCKDFCNTLLIVWFNSVVICFETEVTYKL